MPATKSSLKGGRKRRQERAGKSPARPKEVQPKPTCPEASRAACGELGGLRLPYHDWEFWTRHLKERDETHTGPRVKSLSHQSWLWGLKGDPSFAGLSDLVDFLSALTKKVDWREQETNVRQRLDHFLDAVTVGDSTPSRLLEGLAWTFVSPKVARYIGEGPWLRLMDSMQTLTHRLPGISAVQDPSIYHLTAELALTMAFLYPEVSTWAGQWSTARDALSHGICEWTDNEGLPVASQVGILRPLLACWTRCQEMARRRREPCFHREARRQVVWAARQAIALARPDGSQMLDYQQSIPSDERLFRAVIGAFDDRVLRSLAGAVLPRHVVSSRRSANDRLPRRASNTSEWSKFACLRTDWSRSAARFAVTFDQRRLASEFQVGHNLLWSGFCPPDIRIHGEPHSLDSDIEVVCAFHDKDVEYLELQWPLAEGWVVQRQMMLALRDDFLLLADAIVGSRPAQIEYTLSLPLANGVEFEASEESREGWLNAEGHRAALVLPLALPEWRAEPSDGELAYHDHHLIFRRTTTGRAAFCPLFLDFSKRRIDRPFTWRRLTIGEELVAVPPDVAAGYRVQVGRKQWLIYRSLGRRFGRTILGQHLLQEFVVGRFPKSGDLDLLLQIEANNE